MSATVTDRLAVLTSTIYDLLPRVESWTEASGPFRRLALGPAVSLTYSPGEHASAFAVTVAHKGVQPLAPPDFDEEAAAVPDRPPDRKRQLERRARRMVEYVNGFADWDKCDDLVRTLRADGLTVSRREFDGKVVLTIMADPAGGGG